MKQIDLNTQLVGRSTGRPPAVAGDDPKAQARAWRLEMERAQMQEWLSHGAIGMKPSALLPSAAIVPQVAPVSESRVQPDDSDASASAPQELPTEPIAEDGRELTATPHQAKGERADDEPARRETVLRELAPADSAGNDTRLSLPEVADIRPQAPVAPPLAQRVAVRVESKLARPAEASSIPVGQATQASSISVGQTTQASSISVGETTQASSISVGETTQAQAAGGRATDQENTGEPQVSQLSWTRAAIVPNAHNVTIGCGTVSQTGELPSASDNQSVRARVESPHTQISQLLWPRAATVPNARNLSTAGGTVSHQAGELPSVSGNVPRATVQSQSVRARVESPHAQISRLAESLKPLGDFEVTSATVQTGSNAPVELLGLHSANAVATPQEVNVANAAPLPLGTTGSLLGLLPVSRADVPVAGGVPEGVQVIGAQRTDDHEPVSGRPNSPQAAQRASASPIRLHADWSEDGVRLWLGLDASCATDLASITAHLQRWMSAQDVRLLSVVCNGRLVTNMSPQVDEDQLDSGLQAFVARGESTDFPTIPPISEELK